jgi:hypothetical protein
MNGADILLLPTGAQIPENMLHVFMSIFVRPAAELLHAAS